MMVKNGENEPNQVHPSWKTWKSFEFSCFFFITYFFDWAWTKQKQYEIQVAKTAAGSNLSFCFSEEVELLSGYLEVTHNV